MYNSLLQRQIKKYLKGIDGFEGDCKAFLDAVSASYDHFETDRRLIERSMDISSEELLAINIRLSREAERQRMLLGKLHESLAALNLDVERNEENIEEELPRIADLLREQIEKRREAEQLLLHSEERFRLIAENASDVIVNYDADGVCRYISPSCVPLLGYEPEELIGKTPYDIMHPDDVEPTRRQLEQFLPTSERFVIDARVRRKEGVYRWFATSVHPIRDPETGEILEIHATTRDVTERIEAEELIRTTSSRLSTLIENLEGGVLMEDDTRCVALVNQRFCDMFGIPVPAAVLLGADCAQAADQSKHLFVDPETFVSRIDAILAERRPVSGEELQLQDGRVFERDYIPIFLDRTYRGHVWLYRDRTERRRAEDNIRNLNDELQEANQLLKIERDREKERVKALQELNAMKNDFVSGVSHELRTPLASIIGFAQTLMLDPDLPAETRGEFIRIIHDEGKRLAKLINDLLDIARIESGRIDLDKRESDLIPLLQRAVQSVVMQADAKRIAIHTEFPVPELVGVFDPDRIAQVVINLLGNAVKFTDDGGEVTLSVFDSPDTIRISVRDNGLGIPEADIPHLFDKFFRVNRPGLDIRGTGLGLAIARQLVELHGGTASVKSEVGVGSTFTIEFPKE